MVLRMLRVAVPPSRWSRSDGHESEALALLHAVGGFQAYRRAVRHAPTVGPVVRFLLLRQRLPGLGRVLGRGAARRADDRRRAAALLAAGAAARAADRRPRAPAPRPGRRRRARTRRSSGYRTSSSSSTATSTTAILRSPRSPPCICRRVIMPR